MVSHPNHHKNPKSRSPNSGLWYSYAVDYRTLRWIYFLDLSRGLAQEFPQLRTPPLLNRAYSERRWASWAATSPCAGEGRVPGPQKFVKQQLFLAVFQGFGLFFHTLLGSRWGFALDSEFRFDGPLAYQRVAALWEAVLGLLWCPLGILTQRNQSNYFYGLRTKKRNGMMLGTSPVSWHYIWNPLALGCQGPSSKPS